LHLTIKKLIFYLLYVGSVVPSFSGVSDIACVPSLAGVSAVGCAPVPVASGQLWVAISLLLLEPLFAGVPAAAGIYAFCFPELSLFQSCFKIVIFYFHKCISGLSDFRLVSHYADYSSGTPEG
jgi:hypothetical protein